MQYMHELSRLKFWHQTMLRFGIQILQNTIKANLFHRPCGTSRFSVIAGSNVEPPRTYQVVVAATRYMGIGKDGKLPWKLTSDLKFFKEITTETWDPTKRNAVVMGRKTWESIPLEFRPLPARLNVVLTRSGLLAVDDPNSDNVVVFLSIGSALNSLALPPYCHSIETVFVIGGGEVLRETMNAHECQAIHITEIETSYIECDTFVPAIDLSSFRLWYSSQPVVEKENNVRFSFATYVRPKIDEFGIESFKFLPKTVFERHEEYLYLKMLREIMSSAESENGALSRSSCEIRFNLRKSFPLLTTKTVSWNGVIEQLFRFITSSSKAKLLDVIDKIKSSQQSDKPIIFSTAQDPSDLRLQFSVANEELSCQTYQASADMALSVPLFIASYALLTGVIAHLCGLVAGDLTCKLGEAFVNWTQVNAIQEQIQKHPKPFPILKINPMKKDIDTLVAQDFELIGYDPHN